MQQGSPSSHPLRDARAVTTTTKFWLTRNPVPNGGRNVVGQRSANCLTRDRPTQLDR